MAFGLVCSFFLLWKKAVCIFFTVLQKKMQKSGCISEELSCSHFTQGFVSYYLDICLKLCSLLVSFQQVISWRSAYLVAHSVHSILFLHLFWFKCFVSTSEFPLEPINILYTALQICMAYLRFWPTHVLHLPTILFCAPFIPTQGQSLQCGRKPTPDSRKKDGTLATANARQENKYNLHLLLCSTTSKLISLTPHPPTIFPFFLFRTSFLHSSSFIPPFSDMVFSRPFPLRATLISYW